MRNIQLELLYQGSLYHPSYICALAVWCVRYCLSYRLHKKTVRSLVQYAAIPATTFCILLYTHLYHRFAASFFVHVNVGREGSCI